MPARPSSQDPSPASSSRRRSRPASGGEAEALEAQAASRQAPTAATETDNVEQDDADEDIAAQLSFREAQTALELSLAELQAADLDVEKMAGLYQRARRYADRCEALLLQVEQEVMQWDPEQPGTPPSPYQA